MSEAGTLEHVVEFESERDSIATMLSACAKVGFVSSGDTIEAISPIDEILRTRKMVEAACVKAGLKLEVYVQVQGGGVGKREPRAWEKGAEARPVIGATTKANVVRVPLSGELAEWAESPLSRIVEEDVAVVMRLRDGTKVAIIGSPKSKSKAPPGAIVFTVDQVLKQIAAREAAAARKAG